MFFSNVLKYFVISVFLSQIVSSQVILEKKNQNVSYQTEVIAKNLNIIWGMTFIDKNKILFTQKNGKVGILNTITKKITNIYGVPKVMYSGQGGLLDVAVHPNYDMNGWIYFTYVKDKNGLGETTLSRAKLNGNRLINWQDLLISKSLSDTSRHFGSRITFDEKGHLFFSIGDRGVRSNAQNLSNHAGSILRLNLDGTVPYDNPFVKNKHAINEIYSYGHRNPQGLFYDKKNSRLWSIEHGPRGGDEINLIFAGKNYGWPVISYGKEYYSAMGVGIGTHKKGMMQPHKVYIPSIAPSSLMVYSGKAFPKWEGNIFVSALKLKHLNRIVLDKNAKVIKEYRLLEYLNERIRCVIEDSNGLLYISTDSGKIFKIMPN